jgi:mono/diheme cytochrome c family protein
LPSSTRKASRVACPVPWKTSPPAETLASQNRGRLLTFKLGGKLELELPPARPPAPLEAISVVEDEALVEAGGETFTHWCVTCHGAAAIGGGTVPDLRRLAPPRYAELGEIILGGALVEAGMPSFGEWLDAQDVEALRAYLLTRRAALREEERLGGSTHSDAARGEGS